MLQWGFYAAPDRMTKSAKKAFLNAIVYMKQFDGRRPLVQKQGRSRDWYRQYIASVRTLDSRDAKYRDRYEKYLRGNFPKEVIAKVGLNADALEKWRQSNEEYFYATERYKLGVDTDLQELQLSNRKPEFLDWVTKQLRADPTNALALKLAKRYLGEAGKDGRTAIAWIEENRARLFFSDQGGYRWYVDTRTTHANQSPADASADRAEKIEKVR